MRVGVTGHQRLPQERVWDWVETEIDTVLSHVPKPLTGLTCLAVGVDQVFSKVVLSQGGLLEVIIPFADYETTFPEGDMRQRYRRLLASAAKTTVLEGTSSHEQAYLHAGKLVVQESDILLAVWDGKPAAGPGGTGDIVSFALQQAKPLIHLNPLSREVKSHQGRIPGGNRE